MSGLSDNNLCNGSSGSFCPTCDVFIPNEASRKAHLVGKKHLKNVEKETEWKECAGRSVYVNGIKPLISPELQLADYFGKFGPIKKITLDKTQRNYAIIEMANADTISEILKVLHPEVNGVILTVKPRSLKTIKQCQKSNRETHKDTQLDKELWKTLLHCDNADGQLNLLEKSLQLSEAEIHIRGLIVQLLQTALREGFPGCCIVPFGSSVNGFGIHNCDLDLHFQYSSIHSDITNGFTSSEKNENKTEILQAVSVIIKQCVPDCINIKTILHARLPVIKFQHKTSGIKCDISLSNEIAVENTKYLKMCATFEPKFKKLVFFIRAWMRHFELTGGANIHRLNNYAVTLLVLFYLQCTNEMPSLEDMRSSVKDKVVIDGWDCTFPKTPENFSSCRKSATDLIAGFFSFYSDLEFSEVILDTTSAKIMKKSDFEIKNAMADSEWRKSFKFGVINIRDPFELNHNVGGNVNNKYMKLLVKCVRNAAFSTKMKLFLSKSKGGSEWGVLNTLIDHGSKTLLSDRKLGSGQHLVSIQLGDKDDVLITARIVVKILQNVFKIEFFDSQDNDDLNAIDNGCGCDPEHKNTENSSSFEPDSTPYSTTHNRASLKRPSSPESYGHHKRARTELPSPLAQEIASSELDPIFLPHSTNCRATSLLWLGRRKIRRQLIVSGLSDVLELEQRVTSLMISEGASTENGSSCSDGGLFNFKLDFTAGVDSSLDLHFHPSDNFSDFNLFFNHLRAFLPRWLDHF